MALSFPTESEILVENSYFLHTPGFDAPVRRSSAEHCYNVWYQKN